VSLRAFHLVFIGVSVVLAAFMAAWAANQYQAEPHSGYVMSAVVSLAAGVALAVYGTRFQRKTRNPRYR
jgi:ABC-type Fe3+-siderophore transport system permease subunit